MVSVSVTGFHHRYICFRHLIQSLSQGRAVAMRFEVVRYVFTLIFELSLWVLVTRNYLKQLISTLCQLWPCDCQPVCWAHRPTVLVALPCLNSSRYQLHRFLSYGHCACAVHMQTHFASLLGMAAIEVLTNKSVIFHG